MKEDLFFENNGAHSPRCAVKPVQIKRTITNVSAVFIQAKPPLC